MVFGLKNSGSSIIPNRERESAMAKAHILVLPLPAQGHVTPLMELSHRLVDHGFEVTFVNTEAHHARVVGALQAAGGTAALAGAASTWRPSPTGWKAMRTARTSARSSTPTCTCRGD